MSSQYLHPLPGYPRPAARPGRPGLSLWPKGFPARLPLKSAAPAGVWRVRSVRHGALRRDCMLCSQHLQECQLSAEPDSLPIGSHSHKVTSWKNTIPGLRWYPALLPHTLGTLLHLHCFPRAAPVSQHTCPGLCLHHFQPITEPLWWPCPTSQRHPDR